MDLTIGKASLRGVWQAQPSKSESHRHLLCAGLADGISTVDNLVLSEDVQATLRGMGEFSQVSLSISSDFPGRYVAKVEGNGPRNYPMMVDCGESGTTLRFLSLICAGLGGRAIFTGKGRLPMRPMEEVLEIYRRDGIRFCHGKQVLPLEMEGRLRGGCYRIRGNVSSQYVSGLLMALPLLDQGGEVQVDGILESSGYADLTAGIMSLYQVQTERSSGYRILPGSRYQSGKGTVSGDWSNSAFFLVMNALGAKIDIRGLDPDSCQPDREIGRLLLLEGDRTVDVSQFPDLVPALCVWAGAMPGTLRITGALRLRLKECDRLAVMASNLASIGIPVRETEDGLEIRGIPRIQGGTVDASNDHRIAMAFASLSPVINDKILIKGAECVGKSYPQFYEDLVKLGGNIR